MPEFRCDAASLVIERGETIAQVACDLNVGERACLAAG